jgi:hypothetical protein
MAVSIFEVLSSLRGEKMAEIQLLTRLFLAGADRKRTFMSTYRDSCVKQGHVYCALNRTLRQTLPRLAAEKRAGG